MWVSEFVQKFILCSFDLYPTLVSELGIIFGQVWSREKQIHDKEMLVSFEIRGTDTFFWLLVHGLVRGKYSQVIGSGRL